MPLACPLCGGGAELGKPLVQESVAAVGLGPCDKGDFRIGNRRKAVGRPEQAMLGQNRQPR